MRGSGQPFTRAELDVLIEAPDQRTPCGRRDRTLLLFLARTGARISEALGVNARDLRLDRTQPQVLLRGKGRKERVVPISLDLVKALKALMREGGVDQYQKVVDHPSSWLFSTTLRRRLH